MLLGKDDILKNSTLETEEVPVPEWGPDATVLVRGMSGKDRDSFEVSVYRPDGTGASPQLDPRNFRARLAVRCIVDDDGKRLFADADADQLGDLSAAALDRVYEVAARLSGLGERDLEEMTGNFGTPTPRAAPARGGGSSSASSATSAAGRSKDSSPRSRAGN